MHEDELNDCMHVEWAKSRACMMQWKEELLLVQEEMWQVLAYHKWKARWWHTWSALQSHDDVSILSGISGYVHKQAMICKHMATESACYWLPRLKDKGITLPWAIEYAEWRNPTNGVQWAEGLDGVGPTSGGGGDFDDIEGEDKENDDDDDYLELGM